MPEEEKEIECYTGERKSDRPFEEQCKQCVFETLCLSWKSRTEGSDTHEVEKTIESF